MNPTTSPAVPSSIAIAGAWGYIGRKFLDAALLRGINPIVYDPGPAPADVDLGRVRRVADEAAFYAARADLFHLALHPEHRRLDLLLARDEPLLILNEKPMALPERPEQCRRIIAAVDASKAIVLYDFPELFDPLTARVVEFLGRFRTVRLEQMEVRRSKDREDPANPRNTKRMVSIQYQESVHCLAFVLHVASSVAGSLAGALAEGVRLEGESDLYVPPNPEAYPQPVDGRCRYRLRLGAVRVDGITDFKRGAPWAKRRIIRGTGDGRPFEIDVSYLEGSKHLRFNGQDQPCDPAANSYDHVLTTAFGWARSLGRASLMQGLFPNPRFASATYQLSRALWQSCHERRELALTAAGVLEAASDARS
jgi:predicted dehydrogenase